MVAKVGMPVLAETAAAVSALSGEWLASPAIRVAGAGGILASSSQRCPTRFADYGYSTLNWLLRRVVWLPAGVLAQSSPVG